GDELRKRSLTVDEARKIFEDFAKDHETTLGLLANAYLVKCQQELQDPPKVQQHLQIVESAKGEFAKPARKMAVYYDILGDREKSNFKKVIDKTNVWLQRFPAAKKSYEGEHLRFEQAVGHLTLASGMTDGFKKDKYDKMKLNAKDKSQFELHLTNADKLAKELAAENGDFSERGKGLHNQIERIRILVEPSKSLAS